MNLGAFAVVIAVARKTRIGRARLSFGGLFTYAPGLTVAMTIFLFSLAGIPPAAGWFAKFGIFQALASAGTTAGYVLAVVVAVNSVIAFAYYGRLLRIMWMEDVPDGDTTPIRVPASLAAALVITGGVTLVAGILPSVSPTSPTRSPCSPSATGPGRPGRPCSRPLSPSASPVGGR